jgi:hypothetical protein
MGGTIHRDWAPAPSRIAATALVSLLCLLPGGAAAAGTQTDAVLPAPSLPAPNLPAQVDARQSASPSGGPLSRVRPLGAVARMLLEDGAAQSPIVARLLDTIQRSDLLIYVATGLLPVPGRLDFACARQGVRYLRITVNVPDAEPNLIAALAHELQHAAEIAGALEVTDAASLASFYRQHGQRICGDEYCTKVAQQVTTTVLCEVAAGARAKK